MMMTKEKIAELEKLKELKSAEYAAAKKALSDAQDELAIQLCPHKVGDIVECDGYSHKGKKMVVREIKKPRWSYRSSWAVSGFVLKSDGSEGKVNYEFDGGVA
jgi:hypothetical protein